MQLRYSIHSWYVSFWLTNSFPSLAIPLMPMVGWCQWLVNSKLCVCVCILSVLLVEVLSIPPIYSLSLFAYGWLVPVAGQQQTVCVCMYTVCSSCGGVVHSTHLLSLSLFAYFTFLTPTFGLFVPFCTLALCCWSGVTSLSVRYCLCRCL